MHPIENIMSTTLENLKQMVDVSTVIGEPVATPYGALIIPVSKVGFGFVSGGGEYGLENQDKKQEQQPPFAGGAGAGISVSPTGFLVLQDKTVKYIPVQENTVIERTLDALPNLFTQFKELFSKNEENEKPESSGCNAM